MAKYRVDAVLCWQCGRDGGRIYVRGYCPFREALRTFRVDRMRDVVAIRNGRESPVEDAATFSPRLPRGRPPTSGRDSRFASERPGWGGTAHFKALHSCGGAAECVG